MDERKREILYIKSSRHALFIGTLSCVLMLVAFGSGRLWNWIHDSYQTWLAAGIVICVVISFVLSLLAIADSSRGILRYARDANRRPLLLMAVVGLLVAFVPQALLLLYFSSFISR